MKEKLNCIASYIGVFVIRHLIAFVMVVIAVLINQILPTNKLIPITLTAFLIGSLWQMLDNFVTGYKVRQLKRRVEKRMGVKLNKFENLPLLFLNSLEKTLDEEEKKNESSN